MKVVGYSDPLSVAPGETIRFMVSCEEPNYRAEIVRLIHGDLNPAGPGFKEQPVAAAVGGEYAGRVQTLPRGSHVVVADSPALRLGGSFTLQAWIKPTRPQRGVQGLLGKWSAGGEGRGYALVIDEQGQLALWLGRSGGGVERVASGGALRAGQWYFVAASYDAEQGRVALVQRAYPEFPRDATSVAVERAAGRGRVADSGGPLVLAGLYEGLQRGRARAQAHYDGKLEAPAVFGTALSSEQREALWQGRAAAEVGAPVVAAWDFARDTPTDAIRDVSGHGLDGAVVQMPARAMTGHAFMGSELRWTQAPAEYGAIHFHADDLVDAEWEADFELSVPESLRSGVYAAKLTTPSGGEDYIPFFVRPKGRKASAKALWLVPTNSYLAYANYHGLEDPAERAEWGLDIEWPTIDPDRYTVRERLHSLYDHHDDGSGVCYSSRLRPVVSMKPKYPDFFLADGKGAVHQFNADLHLVDWLTEKGFEFDVATDEDLEQEGLGLLSQYRVVLTGSHHEYWSDKGLDSLEAYQRSGGRFMYLAGNGLYWITSLTPGKPGVIEVRRHDGTEAWTAQPGEYYHSTTGEMGGLWRHRLRAPQKYVGVGFTTQGFDVSLPYIRQPGSFDPRASWIFEGIGDDEPIGGFGLVMGGVAGFELDRADLALGTPPHALVLATATGFSNSYQHVVEEVPSSNSRQGGTVNPLVKGDMVFYETPNGGAVFSGSSISYCGSLSHNHYDNNVSRLTENVLRRFLDEQPFV